VRIGDRVGRVEEISWRAVRIRLQRVDDYLILPNSVIAKADIVNMSSPTRLHGDTIEVGVAYAHQPNRVREIMVATALDVGGVLPRPVPVAELLRFDASSIAYRLTYWIDDMPRSLEIESDVRGHLWYAFQRAGIVMPFPTVHEYTESLADARAAEDDARRARVAALLRQVEFLKALRPEQIDALAAAAPIVLYPAGATIVRKGARGDSLMIVASGRVELLAAQPGGGPLYAVGTREAGDFFGEMCLLTDELRPLDVRAVQDAELIVLTRGVMRPLFAQDPAVAERLSQALTVHLAKSNEGMEHLLAGARAAAGVPAATLLTTIRRVFGLVG
jgi:CRP-like cAMP-binding protein